MRGDDGTGTLQPTKSVEFRDVQASIERSDIDPKDYRIIEPRDATIYVRRVASERDGIEVPRVYFDATTSEIKLGSPDPIRAAYMPTIETNPLRFNNEPMKFDAVSERRWDPHAVAVRAAVGENVYYVGAADQREPVGVSLAPETEQELRAGSAAASAYMSHLGIDSSAYEGALDAAKDAYTTSLRERPDDPDSAVGSAADAFRGQLGVDGAGHDAAAEVAQVRYQEAYGFTPAEVAAQRDAMNAGLGEAERRYTDYVAQQEKGGDLNVAGEMLGEASAGALILQVFPGAERVFTPALDLMYEGGPRVSGSAQRQPDQIWRYSDSSGQGRDTYIIVEAKSFSSHLGFAEMANGGKAEQGTPEYLDYVLQHMAASGDAKQVRASDAINEAMRPGNGGIHYVRVIPLQERGQLIGARLAHFNLLSDRFRNKGEA